MSTSADFEKELTDLEAKINAETKRRIVITQHGPARNPPLRTITTAMSNEDKFIQYKYIYNGGQKRRLFYPAPIYTYAQFKNEYELIQQKQSKLSSTIRKEIESLWVSLYGK